MNSLRQLIYRERYDLQEFFDENQLWEDLYEDLYLKLINKCDSEVKEFRGYEIFNDTYFNCIKVVLDPHPEESFEYKFLSAYHKQGIYYTDIYVLSLFLSYVVLSLSEHVKEKNVQKFLGYTKRFKNHSLFSMIEEYVDNNQKSYNFTLEIKPPFPENPILRNVNWEEVTDCFESDEITLLLNAWNDIEDKIKVLSYIKDQYDCVYSPEMPPKNNPVAVIEIRLKRIFAQLQDLSHTIKNNDANEIHCADLLLRENTQLKDEVNKLSHHIEVLKNDNYKYHEMICTLSDKIKSLEEQLRSMPDEHTRLLRFIDSIIRYGEGYPSDMNDKAEVIRMLLLEKVVSDYIPKEILTDEIKARIEKLGRKETPSSTSILNFNDRVGNVNANVENLYHHE